MHDVFSDTHMRDDVACMIPVVTHTHNRNNVACMMSSVLHTLETMRLPVVCTEVILYACRS